MSSPQECPAKTVQDAPEPERPGLRLNTGGKGATLRDMKCATAILTGLLLAVIAAGFWRMRTHRQSAAPAVLPPPSATAGQPPHSAVFLRPQATPAAATRLATPVPEAPLLVKVVIGEDEATARRYTARSEAVWTLGKDLPEEAVAALLAYLRSTEDVLREERVDALKNDLLNVLRAQRRIPPGLSETLIAMFDSQAYGTALLDYCVQHLGALQEATADAAERARIHACLRRAALVPGASYAGTALIALTHTPGEDDEQRHFVNERVAALVYAEDANPAARVTAIQIAAERGYTELLPVIRRIATDPSAPITLRAVSIGALGNFRQPEDAALLERLKASGLSPRLSPAIERALHRCQTPSSERL